MQNLIKIVTAHINPFKRRYACLCGHKTNDPANYVQHLQQHPNDELGRIDHTNGRVVF